MATIDHSLTYKKISIKNIPHYLRLRKILSILEKENIQALGNSYADVGCSNGYITNKVAVRFGFAKVTGYDHNQENLIIGRLKYPLISFESIDLNHLEHIQEFYDVLTCFETLEHVGNLQNSIVNILNLANSSTSRVIISVPIEIGFWGVLKFVVKSWILNYPLSELPGNVSKMSYLKELLKGGDISKFRDNRVGWGTHFGFDYRIIDKHLINKKLKFQAFNYFTTRFYIISLQNFDKA